MLTVLPGLLVLLQYASSRADLKLLLFPPLAAIGYQVLRAHAPPTLSVVLLALFLRAPGWIFPLSVFAAAWVLYDCSSSGAGFSTACALPAVARRVRRYDRRNSPEHGWL